MQHRTTTNAPYFKSKTVVLPLKSHDLQKRITFIIKLPTADTHDGAFA